MHRRTLMARESDEANLAVFLGLNQRLRRAVRANKQIGIVFEGDAVDLPQIQMIGLESAQRFFEHPHRQRLIAPVRANLRHQENLVALSFEARAHPDFAFPAMIFPAIVEEIDPAVDRLRNQADGRLLVFGIAQMVPSESQSRNADACFSERARRYGLRQKFSPLIYGPPRPFSVSRAAARPRS